MVVRAKKHSFVLIALISAVLTLYCFPIVGAYNLDFSLPNTTLNCGDTVHGILKVSRLSSESSYVDMNFTVHLSPPMDINPNADLSCAFNADGSVTGRCNPYGIELRQIEITKLGLAGSQSRGASDEVDPSLLEGNNAPPKGEGNDSDLFNHDFLVGIATYDVYVGTGALVDDSTGTCALGTYGIFVEGQTNFTTLVSSYRSFDVIGPPSVSSNSGGVSSGGLQTSSGGGSSGGGGSYVAPSNVVVPLVQTAPDSVDPLSTEVSRLEPSTNIDSASSESLVGSNKFYLGPILLTVVILGLVILGVYYKTHNFGIVSGY